MTRSDILKQWQQAFTNANLLTGTHEAQKTIAECAALEVAARIRRDSGGSPADE